MYLEKFTRLQHGFVHTMSAGRRCDKIMEEYAMLFKSDMRAILELPEKKFAGVLNENILPMMQVAGNMGFGRGWRYKPYPA